MLAVVYDAFTRIEKEKFRRLFLHKRKAAQVKSNNFKDGGMVLKQLYYKQLISLLISRVTSSVSFCFHNSTLDFSLVTSKFIGFY
jgi:hypothetical protein